MIGFEGLINEQLEKSSEVVAYARKELVVENALK